MAELFAAFGDGHPAAGTVTPVEGDVGLDALFAGCASAADDDELFGVGMAGGVGHGISPVVLLQVVVHFSLSVSGLLMDMILGWGHKPRLSLVSFQCHSGRLEGR